MHNNGSRKAIIYAAKSTPDERESIPDQLEKCRKLAEEEGYEIVAEYSGRAKTPGRR